MKRPNTEPSGWYFEFANEFYPDIDDTARCCWAWRTPQASDPAAQQALPRSARVDWLLEHAVEGRRLGGVRRRQQLGVPEHRALRRSQRDARSDLPRYHGPRARGAVRARRTTASHPAVRRGVEYLVRTQEPDGSWYGRWGVAYIYGTCFALRGLARRGRRRSRSAHPARRRMAARRFRTPMAAGAKAAPATTTAPSRRPRARLRRPLGRFSGLLAGGDTTSRSVHQGIEYLLETQRADGSWDEELSTGTGFPRVFYLHVPSVPALLPAAGSVRVRQDRKVHDRRSAHEISSFHDGRHGRLHRQEQAAAASRSGRRTSRRSRDASNPFRIVPTQLGGRRQPASRIR